MKKKFFQSIDHLSRAIHLYTGMFLIPWMAVYAISAFCLNHNKWIRDNFGITPPRWKTIRKEKYTPDDSFPKDPKDRAKALLKHLDLEGAHFIQGKPGPNHMTILRTSGSGHYRIIWQRRTTTLTVEKQKPFSFFRLVHYLHFRAGYHQPGIVHFLWAVVVDAICISIILWIITGIYIWARRPRKRLIGGICAIAGSLLFMILTILLCN